MPEYDHKEIEKKWQEEWARTGIYKTPDNPEKKAYVLDMFPYPSGEGLHVGHPKGYIATDVYSRMKRMQGYGVLHPMGWDAFGLPAENFAIKHKVHPRVAVDKNISNFKQQLAMIGLDYDWSREINTTDPEYYKWTQWIFLKLLEKGLAFESYEPINWCPSCQTGLANEDLNADGTCERCDSVVEKRPMRQWVLKITDYADRLLSDLDTLKWPEHIKEQQRNWIGRSEGARIYFELVFANPKLNENRGPNGEKAQIPIFTTRPDTLYGGTFMVLAPEHPWVTLAIDDAHVGVLQNRDEVRAYVDATKQKTEIDRTAEGKEKTGVELKGVKAINPATKEEIPIWIADFVLGHYGTGAVFADAHDERDYAFAKKYNIPLRETLEPFYIQSTEPGKLREDMPYDHREAIIAVVKHWNEDKYLALRWKEVAWGTFVTGGIEEGQTPEEAARAEIREETGYINLKLLASYGKVHGLFYHVPKKTNRFAHAETLLFQLTDDERVSVSSDEIAKHEQVWLTADELKKFLTPDTHQHTLRYVLGTQGAYTGKGILKDSGEFTGLTSDEAIPKIGAKFGTMTKTYKLQDWVFSRQRYWGEPIPVVHCEKDGVVAVPEKDLPIRLPEVEHYEPTGTGESPLANIADWVNTTCPKCGGPAKRETNTMPQWAGSSWYWLRFMDPHNNEAFVAPDIEKRWGPVDVYVGGDHAVRHLIYARFWHKFLYDIGAVHTLEPFARLEFLGFILAEDGRKMSKRWGNVINPNDVINTFGADAFRTYEMFMGPFENTIAWSTNGLVGTRRFIERLWRLADKVGDEVETLDVELNKTVKKVSDNIEAFKFNTAVSQMMILLNAAEAAGSIGKVQFGTFLKLLAPFAPHVTEELWHQLGHTTSVHTEPWPTYDTTKLVAGTVTVAVQVAGKTRGTVSVPREAGQEEVLAAARADQKLAQYIPQSPSRVVFIQGRVLNLIP